MNYAWDDGNNYNGGDDNNFNNNHYYYNNANNDDDDDDDDDNDEDENENDNDEGNNNNNNPPPAAPRPPPPAPPAAQRVKKGKGRQKITMAKIKTDSNLQVTFSKRRAGVFKKASELNTLCGAESTIVIFSPGLKPHSFGHPSVESVANRFLEASGNAVPPPLSNADQLIMAHGEAARQQRARELMGVEAEVERERQRKNELISQQQQLDHFDLDQLDMLRQCVLEFKNELDNKVTNAPVSLPYPPPPFGNNPNSANHDPMMNNPGASSFANMPYASSSANPFGSNPAMAPFGSGSAMPYGSNPAMEPFGSSSNNPFCSSSAMAPFGSSSAMAPFGSSSGASSSRPVNYGGYMVQYPPFGPGSSSGGGRGGDPSAMVPYEAAGMRIPDEEEPDDSGEAAPEDDPNDQFRGYGGNYRGPNPF